MIALVSWRVAARLRRVLRGIVGPPGWRVTSTSTTTRVRRVGGGVAGLCTVWRLCGIAGTSSTSMNGVGKVLLLFRSGEDWRLFTEGDDTDLDQTDQVRVRMRPLV